MFGLDTLEEKLIGGGIVVLILAAVFGTLTVERNHWKHSAQKLTVELNQEKALYNQTVEGYRIAAKQAKIADAQNVQRVEAKAAETNKEIKDEYQARIAAAQSVHDSRVRHNKAAAANSSSGSAAKLSGVSNASGGIDDTACKDGLSDDDALIATKQAIQLDELEKWVIRTHSIDVNGSNEPVGDGLNDPITVGTAPVPSPDE